jgi:hypothetical protein
VVPLLANPWSHATGETHFKVVPSRWRATSGGPEDQEIIRADVAEFADLTGSPRRVRMTEWRFGEDLLDQVIRREST